MRHTHMFCATFFIIFALTSFVGALTDVQSNYPTQTGTATSDWPMFRHDPAHTVYANTNGPETASKLWNYKTGSAVFSSPAVVDGKVYIGSRDDHVYCLNATTGEKIWNYTTGSWYVDSSPAVVGGKVYVGSWDDNVYCFWETVPRPLDVVPILVVAGGVGAAVVVAVALTLLKRGGLTSSTFLYVS